MHKSPIDILRILFLRKTFILHFTDRLKRNMSEGDSRVRDSEEAVSSKIRDTQRKAKIEAEDEARDNIKVFSFTSSSSFFLCCTFFPQRNAVTTRMDLLMFDFV